VLKESLVPLAVLLGLLALVSWWFAMKYQALSNTDEVRGDVEWTKFFVSRCDRLICHSFFFFMGAALSALLGATP
jgi:hypothetical protein